MSIQTFGTDVELPSGYYLNPINGHVYTYVAQGGLSWEQARQAADTLTFAGTKGYLATITTQQEWDFVRTTLFGSGQDVVYIGGSDERVEGEWRWVTGPEGLAEGGAGTLFWLGAENGTAQNGLFASWLSSAFQHGGSFDTNVVDYATMYSYFDPRFSGTRGDMEGVSAGGGGAVGYLVEFGGWTVADTNDAPIAGTVDLGSLAEEGTRLITQAQLLTGVTDVDGPPLSITSLVLSSANGSLTPNGDGTWTYNGAPNDATSVSFSYTATDGDKSATGTATLDLTPVNDGPTGITLTKAVVAENSRVGTAVGVLSAWDIDTGDTHFYSLLNNAGGRFAMSGNSLVVANGALLDYEQARSHTVVVRATDQSGASVDRTFTIGVINDTSETMIGTAGNDVAVGGSGADNLSGGAGADNLNGGAGNDVLNGGSGNDKLRGGLGIDKLTGSTGADYFIFNDMETGASKSMADYIMYFRGTLGDRLDLRLVDANVGASGDQAFSFIGTMAFTKAGQVRYEKSSTDTWVYLNADADIAAEAVIRLKGTFDLQKTWFVL